MKKVLFILLIVALFGCSEAQVLEQPPQPSAGVQVDSPQSHMFTLVLYDEEPGQREYTVNEGDYVTLEVINTDEESKIFVIEGMNIAEKVAEDGMAVFEFEAKKKGQFAMGVQDSIVKAQLTVQ